MGLGFSIPNGQDVDRYLKNTIDYAKSHHEDILGEAAETAGITGLVAGEKTLRPAMSSEIVARRLAAKPMKTFVRLAKKAGPIGVAASTALDTYQGRDNAYKIFGKNANMGQRAVAVGSSIANGITLGAFNFNDPKAIKKMYKYYGGK